MRIAIAVGPPQDRVGDLQLREFRRGEAHFAAARRGGDLLGRLDALERHFHRHRRRGTVILDRHGDIDVGHVGARQRQVGDDMRVEDADVAVRHQLHRAPQPGVAVANAGDPVPPLGRDEGRAVDRQLPAVLADARLDGLFVRDAGVRRRRHLHRDDVLARDRHVIELPADERAARRAQLLPVRPYLGGIIDAAEHHGQLPFGGLGRHGEAGAIPVILPRQAFGDLQVVQPVIGIGIDAAIDQRLQHRARHRRRAPRAARPARPRQRGAVAGHLGRGGQLPAVDLPPPRRGRLHRRRGRQRLCHRRAISGIAVRLRQRPGVLLLRHADIGALLEQPPLPDLPQLDVGEIGPRAHRCRDLLRGQRVVVQRCAHQRPAEMHRPRQRARDMQRRHRPRRCQCRLRHAPARC